MSGSNAPARDIWCPELVAPKRPVNLVFASEGQATGNFFGTWAIVLRTGSTQGAVRIAFRAAFRAAVRFKQGAEICPNRPGNCGSRHSM